MNYKKKQKLQEGFSLIELLVVLALLVIMMTISLFNYDRFGKETELENSVYSVALAIRETQTVGINKGVRDGVNNRIDSVRKHSVVVMVMEFTLGQLNLEVQQN